LSDGITTRERILRQAALLFAQKGYGATSTREIAEAVGVRQPSLFHHFGSKAEIMRELLDHSLAPPMRVAERLAAADGPASQRLYEYLLFDTVHILTSPFHLGAFDPDAVFAHTELAEFGAVLERLRAARRAMIADGIASGEFEDVGVDFATHAMTGILLGIIRAYSGTAVDDPEALGRRIAGFALRALLADPAAAMPLALAALPVPDDLHA
jgi:AcrR family transcriptional regulator